MFNLTGWIFKPTHKFHLVVVAITCFCWLVLGIWYGFGYCPVTEWQWQIKEQLGETNLPASFITYFINNLLGGSISEKVINNGTGIIFFVVIIITVYLNFFTKRYYFR
jgi:ABC-type Na+ efflux pump permease subunit